MKMLDKITIIIPTKNRHHYLQRIIDYYSTADVQVIVADASKEKYAVNLPANITYYHYPDVPYCKKLDDVLKKIHTPYTLLCADDDFIIPSGINTCINFLVKNPDYNSAQGHYVFFYHSKNKLFYSPGYLSTIDCDFNEDSALDRIKKFNNVGIQFYYCVHKTETLKEIFSVCNEKFSNLNFVELLMGMTTVIRGKHKVLPVFYSVRELLYGSAGKSHGLNVFSKAPEYKEQYEVFFNTVAQMICEQDKISLKIASEFLKQSIQNHINYRYNEDFSLKKSITSFVKKTVPFNVRKKLRHYSLLLKESNNQNNNSSLALKIPGFPFIEGDAKEELKRIESYIYKYNINLKQ
jgi:glycosyltransferase domain-containing protein